MNADLGRHFPTLVSFGLRLRSLRLPRPRNKARWAASLLLIALGFTGWTAARRHLDAIALTHQRRAEAWFKRCFDARREAETLGARLADPARPPDEATYDAFVEARKLQNYYHALTVKHYAACNRPWLPVPPDPPEPK